MNDSVNLRDYKPEDAANINELALSAFNEFKNQFENWTEFSQRLGQFSSLSNQAEIIVAIINEKIVAAVGFVPSYVEKPKHFPADTPIIRMLVVAPDHRGLGLGKKLTQECIDRAMRDNNSSIALYTSPIMKIALPMYQRMGFEKFSEAPDIHGVKYAVYIKRFNCKN